MDADFSNEAYELNRRALYWLGNLLVEACDKAVGNGSAEFLAKFVQSEIKGIQDGLTHSEPSIREYTLTQLRLNYPDPIPPQASSGSGSGVPPVQQA